MNMKTALAIVATVLLLVALTMGEGGTVSQLAQRPVRADAAPAAQGEAAPAPAPRSTNTQASADWFAPAPAAPQPAIPVYEYKEVHIPVPQAVVDPKVAAASEIQ